MSHDTINLFPRRSKTTDTIIYNSPTPAARTSAGRLTPNYLSGQVGLSPFEKEVGLVGVTTCSWWGQEYNGIEVTVAREL